MLSGGTAILLLDNLEHLLPAAADAVARLRDAARGPVVVTSRERLQLAGERVYSVAPLATSDAVELFLARTDALDVEGGEVGAVVELCARLDNLPLAVELAAARAGLLAPGEILSRLGGRLDRLRGGRDSDPRQQTLRATIAWSHELLDSAERELFARLAVFAGGATLDTVDAVCGADLDVLGSLLDKSLVRRTGDRVWMLETIREFAAEQLAVGSEAEKLKDGHALFYLVFAEDQDRKLMGPGQVAALQALAVERDNLRAALERLLERDPRSALRMVAALHPFWFMRGHFHEAREMLAAALERAGPEPSEARASALVGAGLFAWERGDHGGSFVQFQEGLACARTARSTRVEILALTMLSEGFTEELGREQQIRFGEEAIALARAHGHRWLLALAMGNHANGMNQLGETARATELWEEERRLARDVGDSYLTGISTNNLAWNALHAGNTVEARTRLNESLELARALDDPRDNGTAIVNLGWVELLEGELDRARVCFEEGAANARRLGRTRLGAEVIWGFAQAAAADGDADRAARLAGAATALGTAVRFDPAASASFVHHVDDARAALGEQVWQKAFSAGAELGLDAALALALKS